MFGLNIENIVMSLMQNPAIKESVEKFAVHLFDIHERMVRIEQKLDVVIAHIKENEHVGNNIARTVLAIADQSHAGNGDGHNCGG